MKKTVLSLAAFAAQKLPVSFKSKLYRTGPLARLLRGALNRAAPGGITPVQIAGGGLSGMQMLLDLHKEKDYWLGTYEPQLQTAVAHFIQPGMVVFDVGANIGYISLLFAQAVGLQGHVVSIEALPDNLQRLQQNVALNCCNEQITAIGGAASSTTDPVRFLVHASGSMGKAVGSAGRQDETYLREIEVPGIVLDNLVFQKNLPAPQALKMDIEGGEVLAIEGMKRILNEICPILFIELHSTRAAEVVGSRLLAAGYHLCHMQEGFPAVNSLGALDGKSYVIGIPTQFHSMDTHQAASRKGI